MGVERDARRRHASLHSGLLRYPVHRMTSCGGNATCQSRDACALSGTNRVVRTGTWCQVATNLMRAEVPKG